MRCTLLGLRLHLLGAIVGMAVTALALPSMLRAQPRPAQVRLLDAHNTPLDPARDALGVAQVITNDGTLPSGFSEALTSPEPNDIRLEVSDPALPQRELFAEIESLDARTLARRSLLRLALRRETPGAAYRSRFVRLVGDAVDLHAPGTADQTLLVALRDVVRIRYQGPTGEVLLSLRVGRPGREDGPLAARLARLHVHILRIAADGPTVVGQDIASALSLLRAEILVANQIWLQCGLTFGDPAEVAVEIVAPPPPCLLAVANGDGLPAAGGGEARFAVDGRVFGPIVTQHGATPLQTASDLARTLRAAGLAVQLSENPRTRGGAGASADLIVRHVDGSLATITRAPGTPLSTDSRQTISIGAVDLYDGLEEFDNMNAQVGTLEERTLVKALSDEDPATIDLFVVNRFTQATRQGEAFIAQPDSTITNTVILDRQGLRHLPLAWTLAHELGHVLLYDPMHPDSVGPDRPWLLMDADNSRGTVNGPKRLRPSECRRMRQAARHKKVPLLLPYDVSTDAK